MNSVCTPLHNCNRRLSEISAVTVGSERRRGGEHAHHFQKESKKEGEGFPPFVCLNAEEEESYVYLVREQKELDIVNILILIQIRKNLGRFFPRFGFF